MPESVIFDEIIARELVIVDSEGRRRIRLSLAGDGTAEVNVADEYGAFVSMVAGVNEMLGVHVDDNRQTCDLSVCGIDVSAAAGARLADMEARVNRVQRLVERLTDEADDRDDD